ncbi:MAG: hypothetical protein K2N94_00160, partial [Lachnospiraceae bacterium]|nr:hypothetical protein [Lachnospiraceae bacterium]
MSTDAFCTQLSSACKRIFLQASSVHRQVLPTDELCIQQGFCPKSAADIKLLTFGISLHFFLPEC